MKRIIFIYSILLFCGTSISHVAFAALLKEQKMVLGKGADRAKVVSNLKKEMRAEKNKAIALAKQRGLPIRTITKDRRIVEVFAYREGRLLYRETHNENAAISTGADQLHQVPYNLDGNGFTIGIWDGGVPRTTHQEFNGRIELKDQVASSYHATHVAGTLIASGVYADAKGMAPSANLHAYDWNSDFAEIVSEAATYGGEPGKIYISNHSYGIVAGWYTDNWTFYGSCFLEVEQDFGRYSSTTRDLDVIGYSAPYYLGFWSAGNDRNDNPGSTTTVTLCGETRTFNPQTDPLGDGQYKGGYDTISMYALAKNVVCVGAVNDAVTSGQRDINKASMTSFSSWGPADDGRIKPDLVANGASLLSASASRDNAYYYSSGTSMSSPNAAGTAQLLVEHYHEVFTGAYARASTIKGLLLHTADDLGNAGPDYIYGWGLMNGKKAADVISDASTNAAIVLEHQVDSISSAHTYPFYASGSNALKITVCWTDPPGDSTFSHDDRSAVLKNDLDIRLISPSGVIYYPYVLDVNNPSAPATTGDNRVDNIEQIRVENPVEQGEWRVEVTHKGTLVDQEQVFSLIITGNEEEPEEDPGVASPSVSWNFPVEGMSFLEGETAVFSANVTDPNDGLVGTYLYVNGLYIGTLTGSGTNKSLAYTFSSPGNKMAEVVSLYEGFIQLISDPLTFDVLPDTDRDGVENGLDTDDDNDGLPDLFEWANNMNALDPGNADEDIDLDGASLYQEYIAGTDWNNAADVLAMPAPVYTPGASNLVFSLQLKSNRTYAIQTRLSSTGLWTNSIPDIQGYGTTNIPVSMVGERGFFRISVMLNE